ncbi:response regulator [Rhizobium lentis]|uniref:CheY-like chemotaxis protein n=1 Tax=Rhizobium lentis TaxID=1138194 RepID=A0A7W9CWT4_9HYPH|nr:response regulator [Rhizobium lentis]MBB4575705.1 CheY-like chemotaxis protein [Rhizobium lentis]MBB5552232.1 CheY-like chemotaxis protein [Rhizobium lentis]MBB5562770.1 CheY-like chemotaxis protein [Rhizobium lentis]MBB5570953.1 CheY-like chemotaxis protein [Rhizobium lentis]
MDMGQEGGSDPVEARDADEAIAILEARRGITIVFTDVDLPRSMNGLKLAAAIRDRWPPIEIIITAGPPR